MKLKALGTLCKNFHTFMLFDHADENGEVYQQWLGNGGASYVLDGLPLISEAHIPALFDLTKKQQYDAYIRRVPLLEGINFEHTDLDEQPVRWDAPAMYYQQHLVIPIFTRDGIEFINSAYLAPLKDVANNMQMYERHGEFTYFAVKQGFMTIVIIMPMHITDEWFISHNEAVARKMRDAQIAHEEAKRKREEHEGEQIEASVEQPSEPQAEQPDAPSVTISSRLAFAMASTAAETASLLSTISVSSMARLL